MPILLDDLQNNAPLKTYTPKFFHEKLTGRGGKSAGLLSIKNNPLAILPSVRTPHNGAPSYNKRSYFNGNTQTWQIPMNPIHDESWNYMKDMECPDIQDMVLIGTSKNAQRPCDLYMTMRIDTILLSETSIKGKNGVGPTVINKDLTQIYELGFFAVNPSSTSTTYRNCSGSSHTRFSTGNYCHIEFSYNPMYDMQTTLYNLFDQCGFNVDAKAIVNYIQQYDIHDSVVRRSEEWQTSIDKTLDTLFENINKHYTLTNDIVNDVISQVQYIMSYDIPLDLYRNIYNSIVKHFPADIAKSICKQNLNLLLSDTMNNLNNNKQYIQSFTKPTTGITVPPSVQKLSPEQLSAVESTEPLILVQAGAGTGKSTLILGRIDYLEACGVDPNDIMVLSFTNAAANNIREKNPNVSSMTIASMIHEIYSANFTGHELSSLDTIINSLDIYYPSNASGINSAKRDFIDTFSQNIRHLLKNDANCFTNMSNFVEDNYDEIMDTLDTIHQTSLELEIIICYQKIDTLIEPKGVSSKYLIMDEVQDNSIFEFIYTLKYIDKHKESLFIVGDCSQTLYEFRASNPRALNILEGSKTFATFQLNVNYRSNQEILDFANIALQNIEANQYANIQLRANSLVPVTEQSFLDKVTLNYHRLARIGEFRTALPSIFATEVKNYIQSCLDRKEQVAFLMFTRAEVAITQAILEHQFPGTTSVSLIPEKMYNSTIMSLFIRRHWDKVRFAPTSNIVSVISNEIIAQAPNLVYDYVKAMPRINKFLQTWQREQGQLIATWANQVNNGQMDKDTFFSLLKENMLQHEIRANAIKQALLSNRNQENKQNDNVANANFLLSTIHSAKGLEFDNVVVFYRNESGMAEDKKRMYYVALTRAMKSEYVLAYDTCVSPQIQADYITVLEKLHDISPAVNSPLDVLNAKKGKRIKI